MKLNKLLCGGLIALNALVGVAYGQSVYAGVVEVEQSSLRQDVFAIGGLAPYEMSLPNNAWAAADGDQLSPLFGALTNSSEDPSIEALKKALLLGVARAPSNVTSSTEALKMKALLDAGFYRQAGGFAEFSDRLGEDPIVSQIAASASLIQNDIASACQYGVQLKNGRSQPFWLKLRYLCYLEAGETAAADLALGLLKERGLLSTTELMLFSALNGSEAPEAYDPPTGPFDWYASLKLNNGSAPFAAEKLSGPYLAAYSRLRNLPTENRLEAREKAFFLGLISQKELTDTYDVLDLSVEDVSRALVLQTSQEGADLATAVAYRAVQDMQAIEFANDRALLIGTSLKAAPDLQTFVIRSRLFMNEIGQIEFLDGLSSFAPDFALSGLVNKSYGVTQKWTSSVLSYANMDGAVPAEGSLERIIPVLQMWALFEENAAIQTASYAGLTIVKPESSSTTGMSEVVARSNVSLADLVEIRLSQSGEPGAATQALMWLALINHTSDNPELTSIKTLLQDDVSNSPLVLETKALQEFYSRLISYLERPSNRLTVGQVQDAGSFSVIPRIKPSKDS